MDVIIEGPDGSGKSTLVENLQAATGWKVVPGEGPEKYPGEIKERVRRYIREAQYHQSYSGGPRIFDRHPAISHPIYSRFTPVTRLESEDCLGFDRVDHLIVYCRAPDRFVLRDHNVKASESVDHVRAVTKYHHEICSMYDTWALEKAHMVYRFGDLDAMNQTIANIISIVGNR